MALTRRVLEEIELAGREHLDPAYVAGYDRKARLDPSEDIAGLRKRGLDADSILIDLGAGTGTFAVAAASLCKRVIAVDVSPAMVEAIQRKVAQQGMTNVECVRAGFLSYEHVGPPADFIYTRNALHHLPDFWKAIALRRMADLLKPGGTLRLRDLVFAFDLSETESFISRWLETGVKCAKDGWTRDELQVHLRDEYSTFSWLLEPMIDQAGFEIVDAEYGPTRVYADYVCVQRRR
jgi:ubiquinone/menaquinone biosynthesis C-methylase UbiE